MGITGRPQTRGGGLAAAAASSPDLCSSTLLVLHGILSTHTPTSRPPLPSPTQGTVAFAAHRDVRPLGIFYRLGNHEDDGAGESSSRLSKETWARNMALGGRPHGGSPRTGTSSQRSPPIVYQICFSRSACCFHLKWEICSSSIKSVLFFLIHI